MKSFRFSQISGWKFENLGTTIQQHMCKALNTAGRAEEAVQCFHETVKALGGETNLCGETLEWAQSELDMRLGGVVCLHM